MNFMSVASAKRGMLEGEDKPGGGGSQGTDVDDEEKGETGDGQPVGHVARDGQGRVTDHGVVEGPVDYEGEVRQMVACGEDQVPLLLRLTLVRSGPHIVGGIPPCHHVRSMQRGQQLKTTVVDRSCPLPLGY